MKASGWFWKNDTKKDIELTIKALGDQVKKIEALCKLCTEMEEAKKKQEALRDYMDNSLGELKIEIAKEEAKQNLVEAHSFFAKIIDIIAGAFGGFEGLPSELFKFNLMAQAHYTI